jgi:hypothetical protein
MGRADPRGSEVIGMRFMALACSVLTSVAALGAPAAAGAPARPQDRPFSVIAVVDTGINPYHVDFRRRDLTAHPSSYIEGFPATARPIRLSFGGDALETSAQRDRREWGKVARNELVWFPGTNVVGAIGPFDFTNPTGLGDGITSYSTAHPVLDLESGHGTAVASVAAGGVHGPETRDSLIVSVKGTVDGLEWAAAQPWIDVVSISWWNVRPRDLTAVAEATRAAVASGKVVCVASMNYSLPMMWTASGGPSWNVNVGAASPETRGEHYYTGYPNDVLGLSGVMAADAASNTGEVEVAGTSFSTPSVCGLHAKVLSQVRSRLGDSSEGARRGWLAEGPRGEGPLEDGRLSRVELEDALASTAVPAEPAVGGSDGNSIPAAPAAPWIRGGYGIIDEDSAADALRVLLGRQGRPDRSFEDAWVAAVDAVRDALWGPPPP